MSTKIDGAGTQQVEVLRIPNCDLCKQRGDIKPAAYDAATKMGPWAYLCEEDYQEVGLGLGTGVGQRLVATT
jgi:hypothetical protein